MPTLKKRESSGPSGGAGLIRYFDVEEGGPQLDPKLIVAIVLLVIFLEVLLAVIL
jgi:preprotein translocase subunit Sec61beta